MILSRLLKESYLLLYVRIRIQHSVVIAAYVSRLALDKDLIFWRVSRVGYFYIPFVLSLYCVCVRGIDISAIELSQFTVQPTLLELDENQALESTSAKKFYVLFLIVFRLTFIYCFFSFS